jgi:hypothetical protein
VKNRKRSPGSSGNYHARPLVGTRLGGPASREGASAVEVDLVHRSVADGDPDPPFGERLGVIVVRQRGDR